MWKVLLYREKDTTAVQDVKEERNFDAKGWTFNYFLNFKIILKVFKKKIMQKNVNSSKIELKNQKFELKN